MSAKDNRLLDAERALDRLEMQIEQYQIHLEQLGEHPHEAEKARGVLDRMISELEWKRKYCELVANAKAAARAKNGSHAL